jgi:multidrug efflux pump subunit AcrA (membrane-fusion protein)
MLLFVDNAGGELMTGAFASVHLDLAAPATTVNVPASALIFGQDGLRVATVGSDGRVVLKPVTISRDLGRTLDIGSGLTAHDRIITNPPDGIATEDQVRIAGAGVSEQHLLPAKPKQVDFSNSQAKSSD